MLTIEYRIYGKATTGGGAVIKSTSSGGGTTATSSSGGGVAKSTASGGGSTQTSSSGGGATVTSSYRPEIIQVTGVNRQGDSADVHYHNYYESEHAHSVTIGSHSHSVSIPSHTHSFDVPNHSHSVTIPNHTHQIDVPAHTHDIEHGIFKLDRLPTKVTIKVDGNVVPQTALSGESIDLIPYLALDSEKRVQRGWHTVEITPNDLGRINAQLMTQFFMQSRGGVDA